MTRRTWLVTGTSKGFGLATVKALLSDGYQVAATTRSLDSLLSSLGTAAASPNLLPLEVNLLSDDSISSAVSATIDRFGQLDVLVNNAGFGLTGAVEELSREDILKQFQVNFIAPHSFIKAALPHFRARLNGHILNISSIAAFSPSAGWGLYSASKAALNALSDALTDEVAPFGIRVTSVMPGPFLTNFRVAIDGPAAEVEGYEHVHEAKRRMFETKQPGNADKAARLFIELANSADPPKWIFLGASAVQRATARCAKIQSEIETWRAPALATDDTE
jgi:NAD(P)-dependent dehydrogenase (short-subunit alcohol dehydrogenase family)